MRTISAAARGFAQSYPHVRVVAERKRGAMGWDLRSGLDAATGLGVPAERRVVSAHRTPDRMFAVHINSHAEPPAEALRERSTRTRRRILPAADFGIWSTNSTTRMRL